ncbi:MAG TPA: HAD family phosphatase [Hanamia sp.]|nr:HAD family phosphatase [Hanamia sp.]
MENIKNIIFDLGGVLLDIDYNLTRTAFEKAGVAHFDDMYSQAAADQLFQKLETGKISEDNFYKELNHSTGMDLSPKEIRNAWNAMLLSFRENSLHALMELKDKYQLYLLSNTNFIHMEAFNGIYHSKRRAFPFNAYFNKAFYSCEIGFRKPDAICYAWVIDHLKIDAAETLFIDDSVQNVEAAKRAGMKTAHLANGEKIEELGL